MSHKARLMHFIGEVEVVFGLWAVALLFGIVFFFDWPTAVDYVEPQGRVHRGRLRCRHHDPGFHSADT